VKILQHKTLAGKQFLFKDEPYIHALSCHCFCHNFVLLAYFYTQILLIILNKSCFFQLIYFAFRSLAVGIGIQNFPEGLAVSLPLRAAGISPWKSFWLVCFVCV